MTVALLRRKAGRPARAPPVARDVDALLRLPKAQTWAAIEILTDLARNVRLVDRIDLGIRSGVIERCAAYYTPSGTMSVGVAETVFPRVMHLLGASQISRELAASLGYVVRRCDPGKSWGHFWLVPDPARSRALLTGLATRGWARISMSRHAYADPIEVPSVVRGRTRWILCPCHDDHDPSAQVNASGVVYCYACARVVGRAGHLGPDAVVFSAIVRSVVEPDRALPRPNAPVGVPYYPGPRPALSLCYSTVIAQSAGSPGPAPTSGGRPTGQRWEDRNGTTGLREPMATGILLGRRFGDPNDPRRKGTGAFRRSFSSARDLLDALRTSDRMLAGPRAMDRATQADAAHATSTLRDHRHFLPDHYVALDRHAWTSVREICKGPHTSGETMYLRIPETFAPAVTEWVGVDLDGFDAAPVGNETLSAAGERIRVALERHPCFTGRVGVVRTSHLGVQVVAQLSRARHDPSTFFADPHVRGMLGALDALCLAEVRAAGFEGGHADPTVHAPGRYVRRPGPRKTKQGSVYVSRLVFATP